jgi:hypothetical protein
MSAHVSSMTSYEHNLYYKTVPIVPKEPIVVNTFEYSSRVLGYRIILQKITKINWKGFVIIPINHFVCEVGYDFESLNVLGSYPPAYPPA